MPILASTNLCSIWRNASSSIAPSAENAVAFLQSNCNFDIVKLPLGFLQACQTSASHNSFDSNRRVPYHPAPALGFFLQHQRELVRSIAYGLSANAGQSGLDVRHAQNIHDLPV